MPNGHDDVDADTTLTPSRVRTVGVVQRRVFVSKPLGFIERLDSIAVEEPLEIKVQGPGQEPVNIAVTMRTPGHDLELAVGFLWTEGLIHSLEDLAEIAPTNSRDQAQGLQYDHAFTREALRRDGASAKFLRYIELRHLRQSRDRTDLGALPASPARSGGLSRPHPRPSDKASRSPGCV